MPSYISHPSSRFITFFPDFYHGLLGPSGEWALFAFITDSALQRGLQADFRELNAAVQGGLWKSAHVLSGSILEAVLCDFLIVSGHKGPGGIDPAQLDLGKLIDACVSEGALSPKVKDLTSALRQYRNLIHPGRAVRLGEEVSESTAKVVAGVLEIAIGEVVKKKRSIYGYTAEQIVNKLQIDPHAVRLLSHLLDGVREYELRRLLVDVLPNRYAEESLTPSAPHMKESVKACFHAVFGRTMAATRKEVAAAGVKLLREDSDEAIRGYQDSFFRAAHLEYLDQKERALVKARLLARAEKEVTNCMFDALFGIEPFLRDEELPIYLDFLVKASFWGIPETLKTSADAALF